MFGERATLHILWMYLCTVPPIHRSSSLTRHVTSQQEDAGFKPHTTGWVLSVQMFSFCLCEFSLGVPVSSNGLKTSSSSEVGIALPVCVDVCIRVNPVLSLSDSPAKPWATFYLFFNVQCQCLNFHFLFSMKIVRYSVVSTGWTV